MRKTNPNELLLDGNRINVTITMINESDQNRDFFAIVKSIPFELGSSATYATELRYPSNSSKFYFVETRNSTSFVHSFKADWDGRWSITVHAEGIARDDAPAILGDATGDFKIHPLSDRLILDSNAITREAAENASRLTSKSNQIAADSLADSQKSTQAAQSAAIGTIAGSAILVIVTLWYQRRTANTMRDQLQDERVTRREEEYHNHSKHITRTLIEWIDRTFVPSTVEDRDISFRVQPFQEHTKIAYLEEGKEHLKNARSPILTEFNDMKENSETLTSQICSKMVTDKDSFQKIILEKLDADCKTLTRVNKDTRQDHSFVAKRVFQAVFERASTVMDGKSPDDLGKTDASGLILLRHDSNYTMACANAAETKALEDAITDLQKDVRIHDKIREFGELEKQLEKNAATRIKLKGEIELLDEHVAKGDRLAGYPCKKCRKNPAGFEDAS